MVMVINDNDNNSGNYYSDPTGDIRCHLSFSVSQRDYPRFRTINVFSMYP